jgi:hypothetical protein
VRAHVAVFGILVLLGFAFGAQAADEAERLQSVKKLYEQKEWEEVLRDAQGPTQQSPDFDYYAGMALSHLGRTQSSA